MFLIIHDIGQTSSQWLPYLKYWFKLDKNWTDKEILQTFTCFIPGHDSNDIDFNLLDIQKQISENLEQQTENQLKIANSLILNKNKGLAKILKSPNLNLLGDGFGGVVSVRLTAHKPVESLILCNCGVNFNKINLLLAKINLTKLKNTNRQTLLKKYNETNLLQEKILLSLILENPKVRGLYSALRIMEKYNFTEFYKKKFSLEQKSKLAKTPILNLSSLENKLVSQKKILELHQIIESFDNKKTNKIVVSNEKAVFQELQNSKTLIKTYRSKEFLMDQMPRVALDILDFWNNLN